MTRWIPGIVIMAGLVAVAGCLVVPIPVNYHAAGSRTNVSPATEVALEIGVTTREDILLMLGEPDLYAEDGRVLGYAWTKVTAVVVVVLPYAGSAGELGQNAVLKLTFDDHDQLATIEFARRFWSDEL